MHLVDLLFGAAEQFPGMFNRNLLRLLLFPIYYKHRETACADNLARVVILSKPLSPPPIGGGREGAIN